MSGFVKLDNGMLRSSLWIERDQRSVFVTALLMAEPWELVDATPQLAVQELLPTGWMVPPGWYGMVRAAGPAIVQTDGIPDMAQGLAILEQLGSPDPNSRSSEYEGRRLVRINGGYLVLNYFKYRDRDFNAAARMRKLRERRKAAKGGKAGVPPAVSVALPPHPVTANGANVTRNVTHSRGQRADNCSTAPRARPRGRGAARAGKPDAYAPPPALTPEEQARVSSDLDAKLARVSSRNGHGKA